MLPQLGRLLGGVICFHSIVNISLSFNRPYPFVSLLVRKPQSYYLPANTAITGLLSQGLSQTSDNIK